MSHQILSKTTVFKGHAFQVENLLVRLPDERQRNYDLVRHNDSVTILPLDQDDNLWFVTQFRMGSARPLLELPAGVMHSDEHPIDCARREIREEIGMAADSLDLLGAIYLAPGYSSELNHIYLARQLYPAPLEMDDDEFLQVRQIPVGQISALVQRGELQDSKSLAALFLAAAQIPQLLH